MADLSPQDFVGFHTDSSDAFDLENVRLSLIRQEDTTIFNIIERAQFARNSAIYDADCIAVPGLQHSLVTCRLKNTCDFADEFQMDLTRAT